MKQLELKGLDNLSEDQRIHILDECHSKNPLDSFNGLQLATKAEITKLKLATKSEISKLMISAFVTSESPLPK